MLQFTENKILPQGIHVADWNEIESVLGERLSAWRSILLTELKAYITEIRSLNLGGYLILDGSFVMACIKNPDDIDLMVVLPKDWDKNNSLVNHNTFARLFDNFQITADYPHLDVKFAIMDSVHLKFWLQGFETIYQDNHFFTDSSGNLFDIPEGIKKGLIQVNL